MKMRNKVSCPKCGGFAFAIYRERLGDRLLAGEKLTAECVSCGYSESLYKLGE